MSGGHFDYNQYRINDIADSIERELNRQGKEKPKDELYGDKEYFSKERFDRIYKELFYGIFADFIASYDYLDKMINGSLFVRDKEIVDKE